MWDLRARCEQQIRALDDAQQLLEQYRDSRDIPSIAKDRLLADLAAVRDAHAAIGDRLTSCGRFIVQLTVFLDSKLAARS
jgi:hypothetical protein